jgi:hypothetical protein
MNPKRKDKIFNNIYNLGGFNVNQKRKEFITTLGCSYKKQTLQEVTNAQSL